MSIGGYARTSFGSILTTARLRRPSQSRGVVDHWELAGQELWMTWTVVTCAHVCCNEGRMRLPRDEQVAGLLKFSPPYRAVTSLLHTL